MTTGNHHKAAMSGNRAQEEPTIKQRLIIDVNSPAPLIAQIRDGLRRWVSDLTPGSRLPPERVIAEQLGVARGTVRKAIMALVKDGALTRGIKGTFVSRKGAVHDDLHPFAMSSPPYPPAHQRLRIVLFENWPTQRAAWQRIVARFNESHFRLRLEIEWLHRAVDSLERYQAYIRRRRPDLIMLSDSMALRMIREQRLHPLPDDLAATLRSDKYYADIFGLNKLTNHVVPMHIAAWGVLWNEAVVGELDAATVSNIQRGGLARVMATLGPRLPSGVNLLPKSATLPLIHGMPVRAFTEDAWRQTLKDAFEGMEALRGVRRQLEWMDATTEAVNAFCSGKFAFYADCLSYIMNTTALNGIRWKGTFLTPSQGASLASGSIVVGAPVEAVAAEEIWDIARFLASPTAQDEIARGHINAAYCRSSNRCLLDFLRTGDQTMLDASLNNLYLLEADRFNWNGIFFVPLRDVFRSVLDGQQSADAALPIAMEHIRRHKKSIEQK